MGSSSRFIVASAVAVAATLGYGTLRAAGVFAWECTVRYLNPWQHAFSCAALEAIPYVLVFAIAFLVAYLLVRPRMKAA